MPPWHIDKTVGIQHFENDRSLSDEQIDTIVRWVDAGAPMGDPKDMPAPIKWADDNVWNYAAKFGEPDLVIKSPPCRMPAQAGRVVQAVVDDRPHRSALGARDRDPSDHDQGPQDHASRARAPAAGRNGTRWRRGVERRAPTDEADVGPGLFMEWAVGKQGEIMRPNSGKLMLPGSKIVWDIHYHAVGEEITDSVELGIYFYPKGQEPKYRQVLALFTASPTATASTSRRTRSS